MTTTTTRSEDGVDAVPPIARLLPLGLQHVLAMYAGAIAVPLIVAEPSASTAPTSPS